MKRLKRVLSVALAMLICLIPQQMVFADGVSVSSEIVDTQDDPYVQDIQLSAKTIQRGETLRLKIKLREKFTDSYLAIKPNMQRDDISPYWWFMVQADDYSEGDGYYHATLKIADDFPEGTWSFNGVVLVANDLKDAKLFT